MEIIDLHSHIMPYVDDGAADTEEALELLRSEFEQGVTHVCLTPHLRRGMFNSTDEKVLTGFDRLQDEAKDAGLRIRLHLSREYYFDSDFVRRLKAGDVIPMGPHKTLLIEFSYDTPAGTLMEASKLIKEAGFMPLYAHVERYGAIMEDPGIVKDLVKAGTLIQVNASSLLGLEGWRQKHVAKQLLKQKTVHIVASDSHDMDLRTPNLKRCADYLERKVGAESAELLLSINPKAILFGSTNSETK